MPTNPERRTQILDAAIDILCDDGVRVLTHRQVDSRAGVRRHHLELLPGPGRRFSKRPPPGRWNCIGSG